MKGGLYLPMGSVCRMGLGYHISLMSSLPPAHPRLSHSWLHPGWYLNQSWPVLKLARDFWSGKEKQARIMASFTQNVGIRKLSNPCQLVGEKTERLRNALSIIARWSLGELNCVVEKTHWRRRLNCTKRGDDEAQGGPERLSSPTCPLMLCVVVLCGCWWARRQAPHLSYIHCA